MSLMGVDVGTTGCKVVAFEHDGTVLAQAAREYPLLSPQPGWYELDPEQVWSFLCDCLREVNAQLRGDPVTALALSSQGEAMIPITRDGTVLANSPVSSDRRNTRQSAELEAGLGRESIYAITGQPMDTIYTVPKVLWWREHLPHLLDESWKILCYVDFVAYRLGAQAAIDYSMAARTLAFDVHRLDWSDGLLAAGGLRREQLATPVPSGTIIGEIPRRLADDLGFRGAVAGVTGGHDQPAGALGAGVRVPGRAMLSIGTTEAMVAVTDAPRPEMLACHVSCYPHAAPGSFVDAGVLLEGEVELGEGVSIGPSVSIKDTRLGDAARVEANCVIEGAEIGPNCRVGPFARLRPGTRLGPEVHIGTFVEVKNAKLGARSKANHQAYLGDVEIGEDCNIGAGVITCNYDGAEKHKTKIGDRAFIGSNVTLIAPLTIENDAYVAAGSTLSKEGGEAELAGARGRQRNLKNWTPPGPNKKKDARS